MTSLLARLRKLDKEATPPRWKWIRGDKKHGPGYRFGGDRAMGEAGYAVDDTDADLIVECRNSLPAVLNLIEAADREANWDEPRIVPTKECPDRIEAIRLLRKAVAVFVSGQEEPK